MAMAANMNIKKRKRIGNVAAFLYISLAFFFDVLQFGFYLLGLIPIFGLPFAFIMPPFISGMAIVIFSLSFLIFNGISPLDFRGSLSKAFALFGSVIAEVVPLLSSLPLLTFGVSLFIFQTRREDAAYNEQMAAEQRRMTREMQKMYRDVASFNTYERNFAQQRIANDATGRYAEAA